MNHVVNKNNIIKKENRNFLVLMFMYFAASLGVLDREIMNQKNILLIRYVTIMIGSIYFLNSYRKKYSLEHGGIGVPSKINSVGLMFIWILFSISVIVSQSFNGVFPLEGIFYLIFNPIIYFIVIPRVLNNPEHTIVKASFYASFSYLILSLLYKPIILGWSYSGITYNPNSIGQLAVQASVSSFCLLLASLNTLKSKMKKSILYFTCFIISISFVFISRSRASFISMLLSVTTIMLMYIIHRKVQIKKVAFAAITFIFIYYVKLREYLHKGVLNKFSSYSGETLLTGRNYIWKRILQDICILGHGSTYFTQEIGVGAHNSIMEIIGVFGIVSGIFLSLFYIGSLIVSVRYALLNRKNIYFYVPLGVVMVFFTLSMVESMFGIIGKSMTMVFLNIIGVLMSSKVKNKQLTE